MAELDRTGKPVDVLQAGLAALHRVLPRGRGPLPAPVPADDPRLRPIGGVDGAGVAVLPRHGSPPWPTPASPSQADVDLWTAIQMGLTEQQWANDPGGRRFVDHLEPAIDMFLAT